MKLFIDKNPEFLNLSKEWMWEYLIEKDDFIWAELIKLWVTNEAFINKLK